MRKSYLGLRDGVIIRARTARNVREGLSPCAPHSVAMNDLGWLPNRGYRKMRQDLRRHFRQLSPARLKAVSQPAMVRLAQDFNMRYPLVDGQGNFGSSMAILRRHGYTDKRSGTKISGRTFLPTLEKENRRFHSQIR